MRTALHLPNLDALTKNDEIKFVITDRADYEFARRIHPRVRSIHLRVAGVLLSPAFQKLPTAGSARRKTSRWIRSSTGRMDAG